MTAKNLALAKVTGANRLTSRTWESRIKDVYNVKDFGALGDYSNDDTIAIQAAVDACGAGAGAASQGGTVFFPPGGYKLKSGVGINLSGMGIGGRFIGSGRNATSIETDSTGIPNGFVLYQLATGPTEIAHMGLVNTHTNIGSGALMISDSSAHIHDCGFRGQFGVLLPFNIYDMIVEECGAISNEHLVGGVPRTGNGYNGTIMLAGYAPHIIGWRSTGPCMTGFQLQGANGCSLIGNGIENCEEGMILGAATGWASHCTTAGDIVTIGGTIQSDNYFVAGVQIWGSGLVLKQWHSDPMSPSNGTWILDDATPTVTDALTTITSGGLMTVTSFSPGGYGMTVGAIVEGTGVPAGTRLLSYGTGTRTAPGTYNVTAPGSSISARVITTTAAYGSGAGTKLTGNGGAGTFRVNRTPVADITTAVPMWVRFRRLLSSCTVAGFQNEACWVGMYVEQIGTSNIMSAGGNAASNEAVDQWGTVGSLPHSGFWIKSASQTMFSGCGGTNQPANASFYLEPGQQSTTTFVGCVGGAGTDNTVTASISNGAGGAGTILDVTVFSGGGGIGRNMKVDPLGLAGVSAGTIITGGRTSEPPTLAVVVTSPASPAVFTTAVAHGLTAGTQVTLYTEGALPGGFTQYGHYYVIAAGLTTLAFELSLTLGGSPINSTGTPSGTHYVLKLDGSKGLSGYNAQGLFRVNNSQSISSTVMSLPFGPGWSIPADSGTHQKFTNCEGTGLVLTTTFAYLNSSPLEGMEYHITDGQKSTGGAAAFGDTVIGGSSGHYKIRYNGTNWIRCG